MSHTYAIRVVLPVISRNLLLLTLMLVLTGLWGCASAADKKENKAPSRNSNALTVVAEIALERGDCRTASEKYAEAAQAGDASLARRASEVALACEHLPAAREAARRWRALAPEDREAALLQATVALKLFDVPVARSAISTYAKAAQKESKDPKEADQKLAELAALLLKEADAVAVLHAMSGAIDSSSASPLTLVLLAEVAMDAYDLKRADQFARQALRRSPNLLEARRIVARVQAMRGESQNAIATAKETMRLDPERASFELAEILVALDRLEEARQELDRVRQSDPELENEVLRRLALLAFESGDFDEAQSRFADLMTNGQVAESAMYYLADMAARDGDTEVALAGFRRLANTSSSIAVAARTRAAQLLMKQDNRAEALALLDDYVSEHPERAFDLTLTKAHLLADHDEADAALELLALALDRHPNHPALQYDRAVILEKGGRTRESVEAFTRLMSERPEDPTVLNALGYTLADHGMELARAETLIRRALESTPDNPAVLDSLGWVRFKRGDVRGAIPILERAYRIGRDAEIAAHWGEALWQSGAQQEARKVWASALARTPDSKAIKATLERLLPQNES